jgi:hypothetical protein
MHGNGVHGAFGGKGVMWSALRYSIRVWIRHFASRLDT